MSAGPNDTKGAVDAVAVFAIQGTDQVFRLNQQRIMIGAVVSANLRLTGPGVAPLHAVVEINPQARGGKGEATIYDMASETGVFVNGEKIVTRALNQGDVIKIGKNQIKFSVEALSAATKSAPVRQGGNKKLFLNPKEDLKPLLLESERDVEDIFDYRASSQPALEVVMSWKETILDVEHFVSKRGIL